MGILGRACPNGTFGEDCDGRCIDCRDNLCDQINGTCLKGGCKEGLSGDLCYSGYQISIHTAVSIGIGLGTVLILLTIFVIGSMCYRHQRKKETKGNTEQFNENNKQFSDDSGSITDVPLSIDSDGYLRSYQQLANRYSLTHGYDSTSQTE